MQLQSNVEKGVLTVHYEVQVCLTTDNDWYLDVLGGAFLDQSYFLQKVVKKKRNTYSALQFMEALFN